jgi:hypothetical protein
VLFLELVLLLLLQLLCCLCSSVMAGAVHIKLTYLSARMLYDMTEKRHGSNTSVLHCSSCSAAGAVQAVSS